MPNSRRNFLKTALALPLGLAAGSSLLKAAETAAPAAPSPAKPGEILPKRQLGKNGPQITMLSMGGMMGALSPEYLDIAWSMGIRCFDTADCYLKGQSEKIFGAWLAKYPERRKEIFLATKDHPKNGPEELLQQIDRRLAALGTTYVDAFYIHGIAPGYQGSLDWPKSDVFKKVVTELKQSGKCRMVGFTCHDDRVAEYLNAAAEGGFVDVIMLKYSPFFTKGDAFDSAVEAAYKAGIGLIAMKTMRAAGDVPKRVPEFDKLGLTTHEALLHAVWSDPRISAVCSMIDNVAQMDMNTGAARSYKKPLATAQVDILKEVIMAQRRSYCPGCPSCRAFGVGSAFALHDISRFVSYYEREGSLDSRELYQGLPAAARDASNIDLAALRDACEFKTDYPEIVRRAEQYFA